VSDDTPHYLLGHTARELHRLDLQGELYRGTTVRAFEEAGIGPGSRVLDIGCGSGDVSITVGSLVGPNGSVLGIDRGATAVRDATEKAAHAGLTNVRFEQHEIDEFHTHDPFDALVGRFVLMHQPAPYKALRAATANVRPGGVVVMIESHMELLWTGGHSAPHSPLYEEVVDFKSRVVSGAGADLRAGGNLRRTFLQAGLPEPRCRLDAPVEGGHDSIYYDYVEQSVLSMLPEARRTGIDTFDEASASGLGDRLRDEAVELGASLVVWPVVTATARLPQ
jgi:ubiquinone/menaquinone biosynthesis C-methylase UbiE